MVGWYDSSIGLACTLSITLPFLLFFAKEKSLRLLIILFTLVISTAIIFSLSRAGIISIIVIYIIYVFRNSAWKKNKLLILTGIAILFALSIFLYFIKKDSADGRILIWKCSISMIVDNPIFGFGKGGFQKNYMKYQADYFKTHDNSNYSIVADSVDHPYNEFILLIIEHGMLGFAILLGIICFIWLSYKRNPNENNFIAMLCLVSVAIFSLFSYPFSFPITWIICTVCIYIIIVNARYTLAIPNRYIQLASIIILLASTFSLYSLTKKIKAELEWSKIASKAKKSTYNDIAVQYLNLYPILKTDPKFLYNYAAVLNYHKDYKRSLLIANECMQQLSNYDLQMLTADNLYALAHYHTAEKYYIIASQMCPSRFFPLYQLNLIYEKTGNKEKCIKIGKKIINKPIKIESIEIQIIKEEMKLKYEKLK
ncbi:O-antigen ligase family protein [Sphingobacterium spiritivorum]|uniref:O-antigen ligase family protein n=1 Tax=Sphingobacterium spiritivorum TaxID=258 RepID=UPI003DA645FE